MSALRLAGAVFDADGTLFDTERLALKVWLGVAREWDAPGIEAHYLELVGRNREGIVALLRQVTPPGFPLDDFLLECSRRSRARLETEGVPVKAGAREILEFLSAKGLPLALATSSGANTTRYKLENSGLDRYFRAVVTGDQVLRGKPDPEIYLTACRAIGADPARTLGVEDSKNGVLSAHRAGLMTALVPDLIPPTPEMEGAAFGVFDDLTRLRDWLEKSLA